MVSEVSFPRFWGVLSIAKCFRFFCFGDRKCRFRDIAIRPNSSDSFGHSCDVFETTDLCKDIFSSYTFNIEV